MYWTCWIKYYYICQRLIIIKYVYSTCSINLVLNLHSFDTLYTCIFFNVIMILNWICYLQEVLQRHPLHTIAQVVQYSDGGSVNNIAFKIGNVNKSVFSAYVFECLSEVIISLLLFLFFFLKSKDCTTYFFSVKLIYP